jgi:serine/threonine protein kinase
MDAVVKLNRKLGVGGRGVVYEGFDCAKGHFVAVKEMAYMEPSVAGEGEDAELMEIISELTCMREAQHPNLVQYYGARRSAVGVQIIMEYVSGGSLDYVLTRCGPLRESVARAYTRDVLEALRYLHEVMHVCHRDVKPANILITPDGRCKLADFGVAKHVVEEATVGADDQQQQQHGGFKVRGGYLQTAVGTPWYMAPEVINGGVEDDDDDDDGVDDEGSNEECSTAVEQKYTEDDADWPTHLHSSQADSSLEDWSNVVPPTDATARSPAPSSPAPLYTSSSTYYNPLKRILRKGRLHRGSIGYTTSADIWSVGVTVYEMITGRKPFGADLHNPSAVMFRIANCATVPPRLPPELDVSPTLQSFLDLCFVYDKELRATARELLGHPWLRDTRAGSGDPARKHVAPTRSDSASVAREGAVQHTRQHHHHTVRQGSRSSPPQHPSQPQLPSERRSVFDGVPLLDAIDLPAYPAGSHLPESTCKSGKGSGHRCNTTRGVGSSAVGGQQHSRLSMQRLSSAGLPSPLAAPPATTVGALLASPEEQAEAMSRYAAARQRIGHTRNSAPRTPAVPPNNSIGVGGGIQTKYGAYVDLLSHP